MFTGRRFGATSRMLLPPMAMSPPSGAMNPAIMRSGVELRFQPRIDERRRVHGRREAAHGLDDSRGVFRTHGKIDPGVGCGVVAAPRRQGEGVEPSESA